MEWVQIYDPLGNAWLSTAGRGVADFSAARDAGAARVEGAVGGARRASRRRCSSRSSSTACRLNAAIATAVYGAAYGLFPIGWIILNAVFLYNLTVETGQFEIVKQSVAGLSADRRVQALLIAFSFGAFIEGAAGFGTPVAITAALLMGLGFTPLYAAGLSLIANTAPVAYGAIGTPILTLGAVTGIAPQLLSAMAGRQLPIVSLIVPAWLVVTMSGWRGLRGAWPAVLVCGGSFAIVQFLWSNFVGPELVDIMGGLVSLGCLALFCTWWKPHRRGTFRRRHGAPASAPMPATGTTARGERIAPRRARARLDALGVPLGLRHRLGHRADQGVPERRPGRRRALCRARHAAGAASAALAGDRGAGAAPHGVPRLPGRGRRRRSRAHAGAPATRPSAPKRRASLQLAVGDRHRHPLRRARDGALPADPGAVVAATAATTLSRMRWPLLTIAFMLSLGFVTRYGGTDATLGLAFTRTGWFYPFFAAMLGWLGVALTGSDTSSNVLFGSLQKITAQQLGLDPVLITTANSTGGVMGKMIDAQSIVVATAATNQSGQEGRILRFVFWHSIALAVIMGIIVMLQAYVFPWMVPK